MDAFTWDQWLFAAMIVFLLVILPFWTLVEWIVARVRARRAATTVRPTADTTATPAVARETA